jgi:proteic killer suppression protein
MEIKYANKRIRKICTDDKTMLKELGAVGAKILRLRLKQMQIAHTLDDLRFAPGGWHELHGDRVGQLSCSLNGLNRLVFEAGNDPCPVKIDGGLNWKEVTEIINLEIVDYH